MDTKPDMYALKTELENIRREYSRSTTKLMIVIVLIFIATLEFVSHHIKTTVTEAVEVGFEEAIKPYEVDK